ncbi:MAG: outer membrane beta-barrel protein [Gammaproteobacteria bacterium]
MIESSQHGNDGAARGGNRRNVAILRIVWAAVFGLMAIAAPQFSRAQMTFNPYVDARVEHDSNVFRAPNSATLLASNGDATLGDTDERYVAGLNGNYLWGLQQLTAQLEGRHQEFNHYSDLNHSEYLADVSLNWKLTRLLDGLFDFRQERAMAPFALDNSNQLTINVDRTISGKMNVNVSPDWRVETGLYSHTLHAPLRGYPDFVERDLGSHLALDHVGTSDLTYGLAFDRIDGKLEEAPNVGPFTQNSVQLTLKYSASALTKLNAAAGYSRRDQTSTNGSSASAFTGNLGYTRQLTGKTSVNLQLVRAVNTYVAAGASEIDTTATAGLNWQATYKLAVAASFSITHSAFVGQAVPGSNADGRVDRLPSQLLSVNYQALRRLLLQASFNHQTRSSNVDLFTFNDTTYGIEARWTFL